MSDKEPKRNEEADPKAAQAKDPPAGGETRTPAPKSGLSFVFKIAPADPKNTFDFEDVADK